MKNVIKAEGISKIYGDKKHEFIALNNVSIDVNEGDFIGIMGPSGAGKSTFLNLISTIDEPTKGNVFINGKNVNRIIDYDLSKFRYENIGFIFQEFNLLDTITIGENIAIPLTLSNKISKEQMRQRAIEIAKKLGIEDTIDKYPNECSGGQRQRAAIARALVNNPTLIVADEPTGNLDSKNSHEILKLLKKFNEEDNKTIVLVTHDNLIASYAKKLLFIKDGEIETTLDRGNLSQKEFFYKIVDITSKESQQLFENIV